MSKGFLIPSARLDAIKADIAEHLDSCELSLGEVAGRQRVTPRYVQMLFERDGTTFSEYVLRQRLGRAHGMLTDPDYGRWTISAIAFEVGFGDLSYFNRAFRRRYVVPPSSVRAAARFLALEAAHQVIDTDDEGAGQTDWRSFGEFVERDFTKCLKVVKDAGIAAE